MATSWTIDPLRTGARDYSTGRGRIAGSERSRNACN
jgi:hypothetical protein